MRRHVLPVASLGNESTDLNAPTSDTSSPDYPADAAKDRVIDNSCITVPTESRGVVGVSATGPSNRKAYYSNYGTEQTDVAAPGGDAYDNATNTVDATGQVLAAYPQALAEANGELNPDGTPNTPAVVRDCQGSVCAYYQYLQGTSMAAPHAVGVAALMVGRYGHRDRRHRGLTLATEASRRLLYRSARPRAARSPGCSTTPSTAPPARRSSRPGARARCGRTASTGAASSTPMTLCAAPGAADLAAAPTV